MILDDTHRMAFIHIPKCGGTSIRLQLGELDSYQGAFRRKGVHPALGAIHYAHIPLGFLRDHYPAEFRKVCDYQSYALTRDPHARFASATFQRLEEFVGVKKIDVTSARALAEAREVIRWLSERGSFCDLEYIHFSRQADYVALEGRPIVDVIFPIERIADLAAALEDRCHTSLDPDRRENTNFGSGGRILSLLHIAKPIYSRLTTWAFRERLLLLAKRWKIQSPDALYEALRQDPYISDFVEDYYAEDFVLYRNAHTQLAGTRLTDFAAAEATTAPAEAARDV
jgi:hypothetical protein